MKLESSIIRFAYWKICGKERKERQNWERGDQVGADYVHWATDKGSANQEWPLQRGRWQTGSRATVGAELTGL